MPYKNDDERRRYQRAQMRRLYAWRADNGKCVRCGRDWPLTMRCTQCSKKSRPHEVRRRHAGCVPSAPGMEEGGTARPGKWTWAWLRATSRVQHA